MLASASVRPWGGSVGSWEDSIKEWNGKEWKDQPSSSAEQQWLNYLKENHPELYEQYITEWLDEVKKTDPALYEHYIKQWQNGQGDFSPFDGTLSPLDGNYLQWQQLKLRELPFDTLPQTYNGPFGAVLPSLLMTGSLFTPKGMEIFSIFNRTISGDNNAFSLFAPLSPQELMMNQFFSLSLMKGINVAQTSGDGKSEATEKQTASASNNGGTIKEASQKDKPWYKKAGDWIGNQYKSVKDAAHSNAVTGEVWDFLIADAEGTITGVDPVTGEKLSGLNRGYNIATTVFKPLKVVDKIADGANAAKKAEKIKDTKKQSVGRKEKEPEESSPPKLSEPAAGDNVGTALKDNKGTDHSTVLDSETNYILFNKTHRDSMPKPKGTGPNNGRLQSHHGLQKQWALENLKKYGYNPDLAPTITIETGKGLPHTLISTSQNMRRNARVTSGGGKWSSTLQEELQYIVDDLTQAGYTRESIKRVLEQQYNMLDKIGVKYERVDY